MSAADGAVAAPRRDAANALAAGTWPAVQFFKSAALFLEVDEDETDFTVPSAVLADWVVRFDHWYKATAGVLDGERLHLVYHREVSVVGDLPLAQWEALVRIGEATRSVGIGFSVTVELAQAHAMPAALFGLLKADVLSSLGIRQVDMAGAPRGPDTARLIDALLDRGMSLGLIGPVAYWRELGLLGGRSLNRANITVYPRSPRELAEIPVPQTPVRPCFGRFRVYVDVDGAMYPCLGMLGVESASLGTVFGAFDDTGLGGRAGGLDLAGLARRGPALADPGLDAASRQSALPTICERHRMALLDGEPPEAPAWNG